MRLGRQFARLAFHRAIEQNRHFRRVPVVRIVRRTLEIPFHLPGIGIERHDRRRVEVVALAAVPDKYRVRVAGRDIEQVQSRSRRLGTQRSGHCQRTQRCHHTQSRWHSVEWKYIEVPVHFCGKPGLCLISRICRMCRCECAEIISSHCQASRSHSATIWCRQSSCVTRA